MGAMPSGRSPRARAVAALALLCASGCGENGESSNFERSHEGVINGQDDRRQWFEVSSAEERAALSGGVATLLWAHHVDFEQSGLLRTITLREAAGVCSDEAFADEPSVAWCSATLIDSDLVLTAGHCLGRDADAVGELCRQLRVVFDYHYVQPGMLALDGPEDVYSCRRVAHYEYAASGNGFRDVAVIQLDRAVSRERRPMALARRAVNLGDALLAATHGAGLPLKLDAGGVVTEVPEGGEHFVASTDSFAGGSGAPVFNAALELVAHQVRGLADWESDGQCMRPAHAEQPREQHQWAERSVAALCDGGWPSESLCDRAASCGDGICNAGESHENCQVDCEPARCGDGLCELNEVAGCARDCAPYRDVPAVWRAAPASFSAPHVGGSAGVGVHPLESDAASGCGMVRPRGAARFGVVLTGLALLGAMRRRRVHAGRVAQLRTTQAMLPLNTSRSGSGRRCV